MGVGGVWCVRASPFHEEGRGAHGRWPKARGEGPGTGGVSCRGGAGVSLLKLKGRGHAVVEVEGARAGRAVVVGAWRWFEVEVSGVR